MIRYVHTNIIAKDWKSLAAFYIQVFECRIKPPERNQSGKWLETGTAVKNAALQGVHLLLPGYDSNGPTLEIYQYTDNILSPLKYSNSEGYGHIAFEVPSVLDILEKLKDQGGSALGQITRKIIPEVGILEFVYTRDPEGNIIEIQSWSK